MKFQFKGKIAQAKYENKLMTLVEEKSGQDPTKLVYKAKHKEEGQVIWLYYWKTSTNWTRHNGTGRTDEKPFDTHIGSWQKGEGWIYEFDSEGIADYFEETATA